MKTAVEWLVNEMPVIDWQDPYWKIKLEKAKEMEKEQTIKSILDNRNITSQVTYLDAEKYYNETFKKQKQL
jgi:hypothetical protein